jgi:hypothetical protein
VEDRPADQGRRLALAIALTHRAARDLGPRRAGGGRGAPRVPPDVDEAGLLELACRLAAHARPVERAHALRFEPGYPGRTGGVEAPGGTPRLVLACLAVDERSPVGVVFTTLIAGRPPQVTVAPPSASIPREWSSVFG